MTGRIVVVGGGISGLAAAHHLLELGAARDVVVLESGDRAGGVIRSERTGDGYVIEHGPDSIITDKPWGLALARRLGLEEEIVTTRSENRGAYVVARGRLERVPEGFSLMAPVDIGAFLRSPILSWRGKARAALDLVLPRGSADDESLSSFVTRRFGRELYDRLAQPLVGGIYGADPEMLSLRATMPRFLDIERAERSVSWGLWRRQRAMGEAKASGARYGLFVSFRDGCQRLVDALVDRLGDRVRLGRSVTAVSPEGRGFVVRTDGGEALDAFGVVLAVPAHRAAALLEGLDAELSGLLGRIPYGSAVTASFAWRREDIPHPLDAYGFVVPAVEGRGVLACTWSSRKWPHRAPEGMELLRVFFGGPGGEHVLDEPDDVLVERARGELRDLMGIAAEPVLVRVSRHARAMPHYHVGHLALVERIEACVARHPGLALAGNAYRGVGIPDSVHAGERAATQLGDGSAQGNFSTSG